MTATVAGPSPRYLVLVVDDDPLIRELLITVLEDGRFDVVTVENGKEALSIATQRPPVVVVLDVMMPGLDGYEVCRALRADPRTTGTHIVMLTARAAPSDRDEAMRAGADLFLTKPFSPLELIRAVTGALNGAA